MTELSNTVHWYSTRTIELVSFILLGLDNVNPTGKLRLSEKLDDFEFIQEIKA
jgi:hypothetical protein